MPYLKAQGVSLVFPLYSASTKPTLSGNANVVTDKTGKMTGVRCLQNIDIDLRSGDRLAVIGGNGAGKTSLLQVLAGIYPPDVGYVEVSGSCTNLININLGMRPEATGYENILLRGLAAGHSRLEIEEQRQQIAAFSELGEFLDMPVRTYSAGMRMRLNFAIATAFKPEILLLDEWLSAGDASFRARAAERMGSFVGKAGILVLASHSVSLLKKNCNKAIWLDQGTIKASGDVETIWDAYIADKVKSKAG